MPECRKTFPTMVAIGSLIIGLCLETTMPAQQSPENAAKWVLQEHDCELPSQYWLVGTSTDIYRSSPTSDRIHFKAGWGTRILVSQAIEPAYVIAELNPELWVRSTKPDIQVFVRVVLPRTRDPSDGEPMTVLLAGPMLREVDQWRKLDWTDSPQNLPELLEEAVWKLRSRYEGLSIDKRDAYADMIVLNLFSSAGSCTVWTDDLKISGSVGAQSVAVKRDSPRLDRQVVPTEYEQELGEKQPALCQVNGTIVEIRGNPFFASIIQHNGEPFDYLRQLGFNTIELQRPPTIQQLQHAARLDLWLICPPPESVGLEPIGREYDRVLAWSLGNDLAARDLENARATKQEIELSDARQSRPLVALAQGSWWEFARIADILGVGSEPVGGSFEIHQYSSWIEQRAKLAQKTLPIWASIQTEMPSAIHLQSAIMTGRVPPMPLAAEQIKTLVYEAISGGVRGMRFLSRNRLDADDPVSRLRSTSLQWINAHLNQLQPWISGGAVVDRQVSDDRLEEITTLSTERSKLKLVQRSVRHEHWSIGETPLAKFTLTDSSLTPSEQPYLISENGLIPLKQGRAASRDEMEIEPCGYSAAVLITQEPLVISSIADSYIQSSRNQAELHFEISRQWLAITQLINDQLVRLGRTIPAASGSINEANNSLRQAQALIAGGSSMSAGQLLGTADQQLSVARRAILSDARGQFPSSTATPLLSHVSLVPLHFELIRRIDPRDWSPNGLPGGDFENLSLMTANGWENHSSGERQWETSVELSSSDVIDGRRSLLLSVGPGDSRQREPIVGQTPLWIDSAPVAVKAGQLVRIHGWARVDRPIGGSLDGLMIIESIGGLAVAERISATGGWQEFVLYRSADQDQDVRVTFALTGLGQAYIDEVTIRAIDIPPATISQINGR